MLLLSVMARETRNAGAVRLEDGRRFTFWAEDALRNRLAAAGFSTQAIGEEPDWHALCGVRE